MLGNDLTEDSPHHDADPDDAVVAAVKRYMQLLDRGNAPALELFLSQHAEIADRLTPALQGLLLVHHAAPQATAPVVGPDAEFMAKPIGDFQIVGELGRGGMGIVYEAIQLSLGRRVALKVLPMASGLDEVRLQRFRNEAHAAAALHHTNIVPVYAVGSDRGVHYYAMQLIQGRTLAEMIDSMRQTHAHRLPSAGGLRSQTSGEGPARQFPTALPHGNPRRSQTNDRAAQDTLRGSSTLTGGTQGDQADYYRSVVRIAHQAALALEHAHQYGVIHRDVKPANLLIDQTGKVWITDFGLAQIQSGEVQLTRTGDPMGTLRYMSPEQATGKRTAIDHRTDIYSLGATLYELLTLQPAIRGEGYRDMLNQVVEQEPVAPRAVDPRLPVELDTIVRKAIAKSPADRYSTAAALADDLQRWLEDKPILAKPPTPLERIAKWRRRNSGLVAAASGVLLLATVALMVTTFVIWKQQKETREALGRETLQRQLAEQSFQQARLAVDTFSSLSESELAYRPELQDLRRSFLETSLEFYHDFLTQRGDDPTLVSDLAATSQRVEQMVEELRILDNVAPLMLLSDRRVQQELAVDSDQAAAIEQTLFDFQTQRHSLANQNVGSLTSVNEAMTRLLRQLDGDISEKLTAEQLERLRQIARQRRLPFTFKTAEVVAALQLTREQRDAINRIIEETRPWRGPPPPRNTGNGGGIESVIDAFSIAVRAEPRRGEPRRDEPGRGEGPRRGGPRPPRGEVDFGPGGSPRGDFASPPRPGDPGGSGGPPRERPGGDEPPRQGGGWPPANSFEMHRSEPVQNTVRHIVAILTPEQQAKWQQLIGEPW